MNLPSELKNLPTSLAAEKLDKIVLETDGTVAGTKLTVNGTVVDPQSLSLSMSKAWEQWGEAPVDFSYSTLEKAEEGELEKIETHRLRGVRPRRSSAYASSSTSPFDQITSNA